MTLKEQGGCQAKRSGIRGKYMNIQTNFSSQDIHSIYLSDRVLKISTGWGCLKFGQLVYGIIASTNDFSIFIFDGTSKPNQDKSICHSYNLFISII